MKALGCSNESSLAVATPPPQLEALEVGRKRRVAGKPEGIGRLVRRFGVMKEKRCLYAPQEIGMLQRQREYERI